MRKILAAAGLSIIVLAWSADPAAVEGAMSGTVNLGASALRVLADFAGGFGGGGGGQPGGSGGHIETLPDGTKVWVPSDAQITPSSTPG